MKTMKLDSLVACVVVAVGSVGPAQAQQSQSAVPAAAQAASAPPQAAPDKRDPTLLQRVEVVGSSEVDDRRGASVAKIVISEKEITRYGDATVADVLRRVPGVAITPSANGGQEVRLRGLGNGYTQILINGEPAPQGFSIESLSPSLIERIEVLKSASADQSTQAVAGTINIILKQKNKPGSTGIVVSTWNESGRQSASVAAQLSSKQGALSYGLTTELKKFRSALQLETIQQSYDASGQLVSHQTTSSPQYTDGQSIAFVPNLKWDASERDKVTAEGLLNMSKRELQILEARTTTAGPPPLYVSDDLRLPPLVVLGRASTLWERTLDNEAKLSVKVGGRYNRRRSNVVFDAYDGDGVLILDRRVNSQATDSSATLSGKYRLPFIESHAILLGWDGEQTTRSEDRVQRDKTPTGLPPLNLDDSYDANIKRLALFAQDEWEISNAWSIYLGLRWEGLKTYSAGNTFDSVRSSSGVLSPIVQSMWKVSGTQADQVRLGISRTYKAPNIQDLMPRIYLSTNNTPTTPNSRGNPSLVPELAWGLDAAYEHYLKGNGLLSFSLFWRNIQNVVLNTLTFEDGGWLQTPANMGSARVYGIELEAKGKLKNLLDEAPDVDLRFNLARNWSFVEAVPRPDNRLDRQVPLSVNLGAEYRLRGVPLTAGGNFGYQASDTARVLSTLSTSARPRRTLDLYAAWKYSATAQLRLSVLNALHQDTKVKTVYSDGDGTTQQVDRSSTATVIKLTLDLQL